MLDMHEVVLFYVNKLAADQIKMNTHLLQALDIMAQHLEEDDAGQ